MRQNRPNRYKTSSWDKSSQWYSKLVGTKGHYYHQHVVMPAALKLLNLSKESMLLDVGCGQGILARSIPPEVEYWGIDIAPSLIKLAISLDHNQRHHYVAEDAAQHLNVPQGFTQAAIILAVQNIKSIQALFTNISQQMKPDGILVIVMNHPCFRIPRQSGWDIDERNKLQKRWVSRYLTPMDIPITMHPGEKNREITWSYHYPLSAYVSALREASFCIDTMEELVSDKESLGRAKQMENRSRSDIPLFMVIRAIKHV